MSIYRKNVCTYIASDVSQHRTRLLGLVAQHLVELGDSLLQSLDNMGLKLGEVVLHRNDIITAVVLLLHLLVEAVVDLTLEEVWVL